MTKVEYQQINDDELLVDPKLMCNTIECGW